MNEHFVAGFEKTSGLSEEIAKLLARASKTSKGKLAKKVTVSTYKPKTPYSSAGTFKKKAA